VFTLELIDLPHKIDEAVRKSVKEAVHIALQAPLRDRFRELPEADMKEILHQRMFGSGSYKSLPEHVALYEALEASMKRAQRDEFLAIKDKSRKRRRDDQDPPPPLPESDLTWKKSDTQDALSSSSKQQFGPYTEQLVKDLPMQKTANISDSKDTDSAHLPKIKQRPEWLKPLPDDEKPTNPVPAWRQLNLTKPGWDAKGFEYKHDYTIIDSPRAVVFPVGNNERKITRFNEIYKFSDGTLMNIMEALDFKVKEYKVNRLNPGMNTRF
nr:hypothetical protein [Tanacetum cinerariifolium]